MIATPKTVVERIKKEPASKELPKPILELLDQIRDWEVENPKETLIALNTVKDVWETMDEVEGLGELKFWLDEAYNQGVMVCRMKEFSDEVAGDPKTPKWGRR